MDALLEAPRRDARTACLQLELLQEHGLPELVADSRDDALRDHLPVPLVARVRRGDARDGRPPAQELELDGAEGRVSRERARVVERDAHGGAGDVEYRG